DLGYGNPEVLSERWQKEQLDDASVAIFIEKQRAQAQMEVQMQQQQMQMAMQQQMQQQQQPQPQGIPNPSNGRPQAGTPPSENTANGQGFNAAEQGTPNQISDPGNTREQITGRTQSGQEIA
ncbi:MAG: hypothetical protein GY755_02570, partial [Chloroflexi bacterium]|nr:hypothetical protein [Chloroflexota bacterium]